MTTQPNDTVLPEHAPGGLSRRTVLRGAAYTVPAVALLSMTAGTAEAASTPPKPSSEVLSESAVAPTTTTASGVGDARGALAFTGSDTTKIAAVAGAALAVGTAATLAGKSKPAQETQH
jgi:hypothetical protein